MFLVFKQQRDSGGLTCNICSSAEAPAVTSILLRGKKFGPTGTLHRAGRPKLTNLEKRVEMRPKTRWSLWLSSGDGRTFQKVKHHCSSSPTRASWQRVQSQRHLKESRTVRTKIFWTDGTKTDNWSPGSSHSEETYSLSGLYHPCREAGWASIIWSASLTTPETRKVEKICREEHQNLFKSPPWLILS